MQSALTRADTSLALTMPRKTKPILATEVCKMNAVLPTMFGSVQALSEGIAFEVLSLDLRERESQPEALIPVCLDEVG